MSFKVKVFLALALTGLALGGIAWGLLAFWDAAGDARENAVRLEWAKEKEDLVAAKIKAEKDAADARKQAEQTKQENNQRGEQAIEKSRNIDPDWSATHIPPRVYEILRQN